MAEPDQESGGSDGGENDPEPIVVVADPAQIEWEERTAPDTRETKDRPVRRQE
jgi:hypothetical protein